VLVLNIVNSGISRRGNSSFLMEKMLETGTWVRIYFTFEIILDTGSECKVGIIW